MKNHKGVESMALYNLSEFISMIKENVLGDDLPSPVSDSELLRRFTRSALRQFSQIYPVVEEFYIGDENIVETSADEIRRFVDYRIPKYVYGDATIIDIAHIDIARPNGYSDLYVPDSGWVSPDTVISAVSDVKLAASMSANITKSPTKKFISPDICRVYNGWTGGKYVLELLLSHDPSLATIPNDAFLDLEELATLDMEEYLYNKLKRKESPDVGVGSYQLKIDEWSGARQEKKELLKQWREEGANLSFQHIRRF